MNWVDLVEQVGTLLVPLPVAGEDAGDTVTPSVEEVDPAVFRRWGVFEGKHDGTMEDIEGKAVDKR